MAVSHLHPDVQRLTAHWKPLEMTSAPCICSMPGARAGSSAMAFRDAAAARATSVITAAVEASAHHVERRDSRAQGQQLDPLPAHDPREGGLHLRGGGRGGGV